jgi:SnoaL-like domain
MSRAESTLAEVVPLARWEVADLVTTWFRRLTDKAAPEEMLAMLDPVGPTMVFPEGTFTGEDGFRAWYDAVTNRFFDQVHELRTVDVDCRADGAEVRLTVDWQARTWQPPAANSEWTGANARQHWSVRRAGDRPVITDYRVLALESMTAGVRRLP